jgi:hypothetical protein
MYDVIVVGARCAGSPAAVLFARRGYRAPLPGESVVLPAGRRAALDPALRRYADDPDGNFSGSCRSALDVAELKPEGRAGFPRNPVGHQEPIDRYCSTLSRARSLDDRYDAELLTLLDQSRVTACSLVVPPIWRPNDPVVVRAAPALVRGPVRRPFADLQRRFRPAADR